MCNFAGGVKNAVKIRLASESIDRDTDVPVVVLDWWLIDTGKNVLRQTTAGCLFDCCREENRQMDLVIDATARSAGFMSRKLSTTIT